MIGKQVWFLNFLKLIFFYLVCSTLKKWLSKRFHHSSNKWADTINTDTTTLLKWCPARGYLIKHSWNYTKINNLRPYKNTLLIYNSSMIPPWFFKDSSMILQWFFNDSSMILQWFFNDSSMILQWLFNDFPKILQWFFNDFSMILQSQYLKVHGSGEQAT